MLLKNHLLLFVRLVELIPYDDEEVIGEKIPELIKFFRENPNDPQYHAVIEDENEPDADIEYKLRSFIEYSFEFLEHPDSLRFQDYICTHEEINQFVDVFQKKRNYFLEKYPLEIEGSIVDVPVFYIKYKLKPIHENFNGQGIQNITARCYVEEKTPDDAIDAVREHLDDGDEFWKIGKLENIRKTSMKTSDPNEQDVEDIYRCIVGDDVAVRLKCT